MDDPGRVAGPPDAGDNRRGRHRRRRGVGAGGAPGQRLGAQRIFAGGQLRVKRDLDLFSCVVVRADKFFFAAGQLITVGV